MSEAASHDAASLMFLAIASVTSRIAQATADAIVHHYSAGMVSWGRRKACSIALEPERYYLRTGPTR
jgi:hypothetical protein